MALIAHNEMKPTLVNFVQRHAKIIRSFPLVAMGITGILLRRLSSRQRPPLAADSTPPKSSPIFQLFASKISFFAKWASPYVVDRLATTFKRGALKAALLAAKGPSTRPKR